MSSVLLNLEPTSSGPGLSCLYCLWDFPKKTHFLLS